jgi:hypothetical protein
MQCLIYLPAFLVSLVFQNDEPPEITDCVVDQTGTLTLQALTPTQPMPAEEELDAKFAELVVSSLPAVSGWFFLLILTILTEDERIMHDEMKTGGGVLQCVSEHCHVHPHSNIRVRSNNL